MSYAYQTSSAGGFVDRSQVSATYNINNVNFCNSSRRRPPSRGRRATKRTEDGTRWNLDRMTLGRQKFSSEHNVLNSGSDQ